MRTISGTMRLTAIRRSKVCVQPTFSRAIV